MLNAECTFSIPHPAFSLRCQPFDRPSVAGAGVAETVVQPARPALPELDRAGHDAIAAPKLRQWNVAAEFFAQRRVAAFKFVAIGDDSALRRCPGTDLRRNRPRAEIRFA